ncbi:hypothetical protein DPO11_28255 [Salmonella enterica]|nr:hypothetical protein [Salmonella enterica]
MSNVPTSTTTTQMICIAIITLLKIRNGRISVRYPDFLKNGIFFNIIRSVGNIGALEGEYEDRGNDKDRAYNNFHEQCLNTREKKGAVHKAPVAMRIGVSAPSGALRLVNQVLE